MHKYVRGILMAVVIAVLAFVVSRVIPGPGAVFFSILTGLLFGNLLPSLPRVEAGMAFAEKRVLPVAIALMGTELELHALGHLGVSAFVIVLPAMTVSIVSALLIGRMLRLPDTASLVLGVGNSVCGSSAILAAAPAVKAEKHEVAVAVAAVNLMGTINMFLLPGMAVLLSLSAVKTSCLIGGSLQAVGQVVAAGYSVSDAVGGDALVIKMLRVLMIGPIVMILHLIFHSKHDDTNSKQKKKYVPGYIVGFIFCAVAAYFLRNDAWVLPGARTTASLLLMVSMAAVGFRIRVRSLLHQGPKAIVLVVFLSAIQTGMILLMIRI